MSNDPWAKHRTIIEGRVKEQLDRHFAIDPNSDPKKIIELTIRQETERLRRRLEQLRESEESGKDDEIRELALRYLIGDWLPELERTLKRRY